MELTLQAVGKCWWWSYGVGDLFSAHLGPFRSSWALFKHHIPCEYCCQLHPSLYDYNILIFCIQHCYMPCHKSQIILNHFLWHDNELTVLKWPWKSSDCNPIEQFWDVAIRVMDVQMTDPSLQSSWDCSIKNKSSVLSGIISVWIFHKYGVLAPEILATMSHSTLLQHQQQLSSVNFKLEFTSQ